MFTKMSAHDLYTNLLAKREEAAGFASEAADNTPLGQSSEFEARERGRASAFAEAAALVKTFVDARQPLGMFESPDDTSESLGRFANWSDADCAAQCQMQSAEVFDPELSAFWLHLSRRILDLSDPGGSVDRGSETTLQRFWREVKEGTATFITPDGQPTGPSRNRDNKPESGNG